MNQSKKYLTKRVSFFIFILLYSVDFQCINAQNTSDSSPTTFPLIPSIHASAPSRTSIMMTVINHSGQEISLNWVDFNGNLKSYQKIAVGGSVQQQTYSGHVWVSLDNNGNTLAITCAGSTDGNFVIGPAASSTSATNTSSPPASQRDQPMSKAAAAAILQDTKKSGDLQDSDPDAWLKLVQMFD